MARLVESEPVQWRYMAPFMIFSITALLGLVVFVYEFRLRVAFELNAQSLRIQAHEAELRGQCLWVKELHQSMEGPWEPFECPRIMGLYGTQ